MVADVDASLRVLRDRGVAGPVDIALILGTGLGSATDILQDVVTVPYADLPGFPRSTVSGHDGQVLCGTLDGIPLVVLRGRTHYYETGRSDGMDVPLRVLKALGVQTLLVTNAAGSLHSEWVPGTLAVIADHINWSGLNPLIGAEGDDRFVSMVDAYDKRLRARLKRAAATASIATLREGTYMWFSGPSFETAAEIRMAKLLGADLVGMSTVPEVILARRIGLRVAALSVITNFGTGLSGGNPSHADTREVALAGTIVLKRLLRAFVRIHDAAPT